MEREKPIGNPRQIADLDRISRTAEQLGDMLSRYYVDHGQMLDIKQVKVIERGQPATRLDVV